MNRSLLFILCILGLLSCSDREIYSSQQEVNPSWSHDDSVAFTFDIQDTVQAYEMILDVDHSTAFGYQNLYVKTTTIFPDKEIKEDVLSLDIGNPKGGWNGDCSGENCIAHIGLQPNIKFKQAGNYTLKIAQHSREKSLSGVNSMTLRINKSKTQK